MIIMIMINLLTNQKKRWIVDDICFLLCLIFLTPLKDPVPRQLAAADFATWVQNLLLSSCLLNRMNPLKRPQAELQQVNLVFSCQTGFSSRGIRLVIPEPAISSARLVGLGLKLYPSSM